MLPFLKNQKEASAAGDDDAEKRKPDRDNYDMLDAVAEDLLAAFKKGDRAMVKEALGALCDYIQMEDQYQDELTMEGE